MTFRRIPFGYSDLLLLARSENGKNGEYMSEWNITYRGIVYPWHCDHMGHMNVMWYAGKFDEACWQLLAILGLHPSRFAQDGTGMAAEEQQSQYKRELRAGDAVTIQSALLES